MHCAVLRTALRTTSATSYQRLVTIPLVSTTSTSRRSFSWWSSRAPGPTTSALFPSIGTTTVTPVLEHGAVQTAVLDVLPNMNTAGISLPSLVDHEGFQLGDMASHGLGGWTPVGLYQHLIEIVSATTSLEPILTIMVTTLLTLAPVYFIRARYAKPSDGMVASIRTMQRVNAIHENAIGMESEAKLAEAIKDALRMGMDIVSGLRQQTLTHPLSVAVYAGACVSEASLLVTLCMAMQGISTAGFPHMGVLGNVAGPFDGAVLLPVLLVCYHASSSGMSASRLISPYLLHYPHVLFAVWLFSPSVGAIISWWCSSSLHILSSSFRATRYRQDAKST